MKPDKRLNDNEDSAEKPNSLIQKSMDSAAETVVNNLRAKADKRSFLLKPLPGETADDFKLRIRQHMKKPRN